MGAVATLYSIQDNPLPEPPYSHDVKANGFRPEVDWQRIRSSKTWRLCPPDQRNNLLRLWLESWNEVPAGSWENDDELIAAAIDMPQKLFFVHRDVLMRGWYLASDGRYYHPVITEMVETMMSRRTGAAERVRKHRNAKKQRLADNVTRNTDDVTRDQRVSNAQEQEQEQEQEEKSLSSKDLSTCVDSTVAGCPHQDIIAAYHETLPELPRVIPSRWSTSKSAPQLRARWREDARHQSLDFWRKFFMAVKGNPHWMGSNQRGWTADLHWLIKRENFDKVLTHMVNANRAEARHG